MSKTVMPPEDAFGVSGWFDDQVQETMALHDFRSQRLFLNARLAADSEIVLDKDQANYLLNVLRMTSGDRLLVFNGVDGEWAAVIGAAGRKGATLRLGEQTRPQEGGPDLDYLFAPLKRARLDYMVQKATELGVSRLSPVLTRHTNAERVNTERMRANAIEAAEQCGILRIPQVDEPAKLGDVLDRWDDARTLIVCDEGAEVASPLTALAPLVGRPVAVLIGPEGGFANDERARLARHPSVVRISLGPRIMRADTAAVAALALVNAAVGDWR